jgi:transcriptional regulator with XRE-family HTH domain
MPTQTLVSQLIRERRTSKGLSQADLADRLGVARNTIGRWEGGIGNEPTPDNRKKLAKAIGGKPDDYLWSDDDYDKRDRLVHVRIAAAAYVRRLLSGEE